MIPTVHTLLGLTASNPVIIAIGAPGVAFLPFGMLGGASDPGTPPVDTSTASWFAGFVRHNINRMR